MRPPIHVVTVFAGVLAAASILAPAAADEPFPPPPGPHVGPSPSPAAGFASGQPIVGTYFFYWYDVESGQHFIDHDGTDALTRHPERSEGYSFKDPSWHEHELEDMLAAGFDFVLPIYWGWPGDHGSWSFTGLPPLVEAARRLEKRGTAPPRIGLFYDTSTLRHNGARYHADLRTERGKQWLYVTVRDFFSLIPPDLRATIDGRPIVWLYSAAFAAAQDPAAFDFLRSSFARDFGVEPYIVKEVSWQGRADATYAWGAALGPQLHDVAAVGPGYDHSAVPGRAPLVRDREGGLFYRRSWEAMLRLPAEVRPAIAVVETWNEWHEGTDVAPSRESGNQYVELTREYADRWRRREVFRPLVGGSEGAEVSITLGDPNGLAGVAQNEKPDGATRAATAAGKTARATEATRHRGRYLYFDVDDAFYFGGGAAVTVEVEYLDVAGAPILLEYDSTDRSAHMAGAFKAAPEVPRTGTGGWRTARFELPDAAFVGRANANDFRLVDRDATLVVHRVVARRAAGGGGTPPRDGREPVVVNDDGAWCWFQDERAIVAGGELVVGSVADGRRDPARRGNIEVTACDLATGVVRRSVLHRGLERDDHAAPALLARGDGRLLAAYTRHGNDNAVRVRVSERPGEATAWREERVVVPSERSRVTYSNLVRLAAENDGRGRLYDFFRGHDDSFKPSWMTSDDDGETWTPRGLWIDFPAPRRHRPYVKYASNDRDEVHFVFTEGHPRDFDNSVYHAFYRAGAFWRSDRTRIAAVEEGPLTPDRATRVFHGDADNVAWTGDLELDAGGRPVIAYSVQKDAEGLGSRHPDAGRDHRYRYARWDGERWRDAEVAYAGTRLYPGEDDYTGGIAIDPGDPGVVYFSTDVDPRSGGATVSGRREIWRGETGDLGASWSFEPITRDSPADNIRPIVPRWDAEHTALLWLRGRYETYTRWDLEVVALVSPASPARSPTGASEPDGGPVATADDRWTLVWSDEFDYRGLPDPERWTYEEGFVRNRELQYYTRGRRENARVEDGVLVIEARKEKFENARFRSGSRRRRNWRSSREHADYTSASITTKGKTSWVRGRIEVRAKLPTGRGTWPAIWTLGTNIDAAGWPACGEIDIMENVGFDPDRIHGAAHTARYNHVRGTHKKDIITVPRPYEDFHVYAVEWFEDRIDFFVDGVKYFTYPNDGGREASWPFDRPQYLILNLAIGGEWGGQRGVDDAIFPQRFVVDYARVYERGR